LTISFAPFFLLGQSNIQEKKVSTSKEDKVIQVINRLFDGMREGDSALVRSTFSPEAKLYTVLSKGGKTKLRQSSVDDFVKVVGAPHEAIWDEKIWNYRVHMEGPLASVWTEYTFFLGNKISHCGVNAFQLLKSNKGWEIIQITDTRSKENCQIQMVNSQDKINQINDYLDSWHRAAAKADSLGYFGKIAQDGIYLGTDAGERWTRDEFWAFAKPYFEKGKAWDFKATKRNIEISSEGEYAWFDELLNTWMGTCRGSGVLKKEGGQWIIQHYNLTLTVPNEKMNEVIGVINEVEN
ncbi:nuclear transport factor 2 family protein, partial [Xanthovirga aplysinae]|uniref:nuclear transport factor 2 family protein n=1 Tax=Xanthovirga aplysinae TaxID=2529853 RepID=UPI0012BC0E20